MANQQLMIQITAQDGATGAFKTIGSSAQQMGQQVEKAGGTSVSAMSRLTTAMKQASVGIGLLSASYVKFAQSAVDNERAMRTLDRTYGEAADSLRAYADELQRTTTFSSEQAVEAANLFGTLSRNYGLTSDQIERLITVSADLAAVNGITLADAAERVQGAIRGEGEAAEALGLTMNDAATGLAGMSAGMTEAEKAAYRYTALLGQAEYATGAAGDAADTTAGKFTQIVNSLQDAGRGFVEMTGPAGQAVAGLSSMSLELGMAVSGFAALGPVLRTAGTAFKGLAVSMGPVGLALAATAAAFALLAWMDSASDAENIAKSTAESVDTLTTSLQDLASASTTPVDQVPLLQSINEQAGLLPQTAQNIVDTGDAIGGFISETQSADYATRQLFVNIEQGTTTVKGALIQSLVSQESWNAAIEDGSVSATEFNSLLEEAKKNLEGMGASSEGVETALSTLADIQQNWNNEGVDTSDVMGQVNNALRDFNDATSDAYGNVDLLNERLDAINASTQDLEVSARKANAAVLQLGETMTDAWTAAMDPLRGVEDMLTNIFSSFAPGAVEAQQSINGVTGAVETLHNALVAAAMDPVNRISLETAAVEQFYATASAVEILNYELELAGDNQELINKAFADFATRVREADAAVTSAEFGQLAADFNAGTLSTLNASTAVETYTGAIMQAGDAADETYAALKRIAQAQGQLGGRAANEAAQSLIQQFIEGKITAGQFAAGIDALDRQLRETSASWANAASQWGAYATGAADDLDNLTTSTTEWGEAWRTASTGWGTLAGGNIAYWNQPLDETGSSAEDLGKKAYDAATSVGALDTALEQLAAVGAGQGVEDIGRGIRVNILDVANDATIAVNALASGFQALVQNPINWGKQAQDVADWATSLMLGADGVNSLSDLWGRGQIETITYNRGLEAQGRIQKANADIQNDVARIQAKQLPIMADLIEGQAKYMDKLADLDPLNQTIALGYMDTTKAAQAQNLVMLAGAAAAGEYGAMGTEMATNIITAAAQADPVLKAMLIDMGLISEGADGEIDVKFTRAKSLNDDLQRLVESIDALVVALGGIPAHTNAAVDVAFRVNGTPMLPNQIGQFGFTMATGGTVYAATRTPMYATAATGATTLVGEAGPEMVWLPGGAQVSSSPVTRDRMRRSGAGDGGGGAVNFYGPVTLAPASSDVAAAIRREALAGARGY